MLRISLEHLLCSGCRGGERIRAASLAGCRGRHRNGNRCLSYCRINCDQVLPEQVKAPGRSEGGPAWRKHLGQNSEEHPGVRVAAGPAGTFG